MPFLVILKRIEIWLLAALVTGLLIFAFQPQPGIEEAAWSSVPDSGSESEPHQQEDPVLTPEKIPSVSVKEVAVTPSGKGMIVELTISGRSTSGSELTLDESTISATTTEGEAVPFFFEPFRESTQLLASEDSLVTVRWWLEKPTDALVLRLQGEAITAKLPESP